MFGGIGRGLEYQSTTMSSSRNEIRIRTGFIVSLLDLGRGRLKFDQKSNVNRCDSNTKDRCQVDRKPLD